MAHPGRKNIVHPLRRQATFHFKTLEDAERYDQLGGGPFAFRLVQAVLRRQPEQPGITAKPSKDGGLDLHIPPTLLKELGGSEVVELTDVAQMKARARRRANGG